MAFIVINVVLMSLVAVITTSISIRLLLIYRERHQKVPLFLGINGISLAFPILFAIRSTLMYPNNAVTFVDQFSFYPLGISVIMLFSLIRELFKEVSLSIRKGLIIFVSIFSAIGLITGMIALQSGDFAQHYQILQTYTGLIFGVMAVEYFYLMIQLNRLAKRLENAAERKGVQFIFIFAVLAFLFMPMNGYFIIQGLYGELGFGLSWLIAAASSIFAYLGFLYPQKMVQKEQKEKQEK